MNRQVKNRLDILATKSLIEYISNLRNGEKIIHYIKIIVESPEDRLSTILDFIKDYDFKSYELINNEINLGNLENLEISYSKESFNKDKIKIINNILRDKSVQESNILDEEIDKLVNILKRF